MRPSADRRRIVLALRWRQCVSRDNTPADTLAAFSVLDRFDRPDPVDPLIVDCSRPTLTTAACGSSGRVRPLVVAVDVAPACSPTQSLLQGRRVQPGRSPRWSEEGERRGAVAFPPACAVAVDATDSAHDVLADGGAHVARGRALRGRRVLGLIPTGAVEQHGPHLPLATDSLVAAELGRRIAERLIEPVVVAPVIPGGSAHHVGFPGTVTLTEEVRWRAHRIRRGF